MLFAGDETLTSAIATWEFGGYCIPRGWNIQDRIAQTHKDEEIYPQSDRFDPDRFAPDRSADKQASFGYIPFPHPIPAMV